jgi:hypothetical protein
MQLTLTARVGVAAVVLAGVVAACHSSPTERICPALPIAYLQTIPAFDTIVVGDTVRFRVPAPVLEQNPRPVIRWTSGSTNVAAITPDSGLATARAPGSSDISAVDQNTIGDCYVATWHGTLWVRAQVTAP